MDPLRGIETNSMNCYPDRLTLLQQTERWDARPWVGQLRRAT